MKLICCGSGSSGNTYILSNGDEALVLDCGIRFLEVKKAINFDVRPIVGAVVSHVHGDHHAHAYEYEAAGIPVWRPYTAESLRQNTVFGGFRVQSFGLVHDVPCCGFLIGHRDLGKLVYITDTEYVRYRFKALNTIVIEANYDERYIDTTQAKARHVLTGHQSLQTAVKFIEANASDELNHVILCHLSQSGSASPKEFIETVSEIVPAGCTVEVAEKGMVSELGKTPF